jgi:glycosyltransferase involved in cell wall biosynthesis
MAGTNAAQVIDLYAPLQLEMVGAGRAGHTSDREADFYRRYVSRRLRLLMTLGDYFICASERQRDLWLGQLATAGRINQANFEMDGGFRQLIDCVPFGTPLEPFPADADRATARQSLDGVSGDDVLFLWGGGIWPWLDPQTAIRATALAAEKRPEVKLLFLGTGHPNPGVTTGRTAAEDARALAADQGLLGKSVLFNETWVPYEDRIGYLAAADAGLMAHRPSIETRYAFRTRLLDCFWAGLPVVATGGDELSSLVTHKQAGLVVPPGDHQALAGAMVRLAEDMELRRAASAASADLGRRFRWDRVLEPLARFVDAPHTRTSRGEQGLPGRRRAAAGYAVAVAGLGIRHGLWRRALGKLKS